MTSARPKRRRAVLLTYQDFVAMCLNHNLEEIDAHAFWKMSLARGRKHPKRD